MNDKKELYDFSGIKSLLKELGYKISTENYKPIKVQNITLENGKSSEIEFTTDGIYFKETDGSKRKIFLYKRDYHLKKYGKPRFHIRECKTIKELGKLQYRIANTNEVEVDDLDNMGFTTIVEDLPLCKNCSNITDEKYKTNNDYVQYLKDEGEIEDTEIDLFGYTLNWEEISEGFRKKHNYTCNKCGIVLNSLSEKFYLHVHHRNGRKTDNRIENLECLCISCHAEIDERHKKNFANNSSLKTFIQMRKNKIGK